MSPETSALVDALHRAALADSEPALDEALTRVEAAQAHAQAELDALRERMTALAERRKALEAQRAAGSSASRSAHEAVRDGLCADRDRLVRRAERLLAEQRRREAEVAEELRAPELDAALREVERFQTEIEPTLPTLPHAYRRAILDAHERNQRLLEPYAQALATVGAGLDLPMESVGIVASAAPASGRPEALVVVLPVPFAVYAEWTTRPEDLATRLAYRFVSTVHRLLADAGASDAPVEYFDLYGCLAMQAWVAEQNVTLDLREASLARIRATAEASSEWSDAGVAIYGVWLAPDLLSEGAA